MAEKNQVNYQNFVNVSGYLKDNTLKPIVTKTGKEAVSGQIVIAVDGEQEYRVKYMASKEFTNGNANPLYTTLLNMLPDKTVTLKTLLEANEGATFESVKETCSKVWCNAGFDVYDRKDEKKEIHTSIMLNGRGIGFHNANSKKPWQPRATFKVEGYVNKMKNEVKNETETGRMEVELLIPSYPETVLPITFMVTPEASKAISQYWNRGDTVTAEGCLKNAREETAPTRQARTSLMGKVEEVAPTYSFVNERIIDNPYGAYAEGDIKYLSAETIRTYLANRQALLDDLEITADRSNDNNPSSASLMNGGAAAAPKNGKEGFVL